MAEALEERDASRTSPPGGSDEHTVTNDIALLLTRAQRLADELAARPNLGLTAAPRRELERFAELGALCAPFPPALGGLGLGTAPGTQHALLRLLAIVGGADLALGRLYEGHVNGVLLVLTYGTAEQTRTLAEEVRGGMLSGVWNTGRRRYCGWPSITKPTASRATRPLPPARPLCSGRL